MMKSKGKKGKKGKGAARGRQYAITLALPGSVVANAQTSELKTYLQPSCTKQRLCSIIDEIVVSSRRAPDPAPKVSMKNFKRVEGLKL